LSQDGHGTPQDYKQAVAWYTKAAKQGHSNAQYNLGILSQDGHGTPQDYKQAVAWYTKAAEQGNANAQNNLGIMYELGKGVRQNYQQAIAWYTKSAKLGNKTAKRNLAKLRATMTSNSKRQAKLQSPNNQEKLESQFTDKMTTYSTISGRATACDIDMTKENEIVGKWMDREFERLNVSSKMRMSYMLIYAEGMRMSMKDQLTGNSPDTCETIKHTLKGFPWPY
jgi:TPR repeat protein